MNFNQLIESIAEEQSQLLNQESDSEEEIVDDFFGSEEEEKSLTTIIDDQVENQEDESDQQEDSSITDQQEESSLSDLSDNQSSSDQESNNWSVESDSRINNNQLSSEPKKQINFIPEIVRDKTEEEKIKVTYCGRSIKNFKRYSDQLCNLQGCIRCHVDQLLEYGLGKEMIQELREPFLKLEKIGLF